MVVPVNGETPFAIQGVFIRSYKNLRDLWLPWSQRTALIGANGVGKTNILDCCALLMGTEQTKALLSRRVPAHLDYSMSVIISGAPVLVDGNWRRSLGGTPEDDPAFLLPLATTDAGLHPGTSQLVLQSYQQGLVRFGTHRRNGQTHVTRALVTTEALPSNELETKEMPWPLSPLAGQSDPDLLAGPYRDLVGLPSLGNIPVDLQWLPYLRSAEEMLSDLSGALLASAWDLGLGQGPQTSGTSPVDFYTSVCGLKPEDGFILDPIARLATDSICAELGRTLPAMADCVQVRAVRTVDPAVWGAGEDATWLDSPFDLHFDPEDPSEFSPAWDPARRPVDLISSGQRRWLDEALHATAVLTRRREALGAVISRCVATTLLEANDRLAAALAEFIKGQIPADPGTQANQAELIANWLRDRAASIRRLEESGTVSPIEWASTLDRMTLSPGLDRDKVRSALLRLQVAMDALPERRLSVRVFDEPEAHLHAAAVERVARALTEMGAEHDVLLSSHHPAFILQPEWRTIHISIEEGVSAPRAALFFGADDLDRARVAKSLGLTPGETLAGSKGVLLVEGLHDLDILRQHPFAEQLHSSGVTCQAIAGIGQLSRSLIGTSLSQLALDSIQMFARGTIGLMFDNDESLTRPSFEQRMVNDFIRDAERRGLRIHRVGLTRPDIIAYLHPRAAGLEVSWESVIVQYRRDRARQFKVWLHERHGVDLRSRPQIDKVLRRMRDHNLPFEPELVRAISSFVAAVGREVPSEL